MNPRRRLNKLEKRAERKQKRQESLYGEGLFVFENTTGGSFQLPKPLPSGKVWLVENEQFQGDSYYNRFIGKGLRLIRTIVDPNTEKNLMQEQKLILDQPDRITIHGKTEHVVATPKPQTLNESLPTKKTPDVLINEDPLSGVEIILN